MPEFDEVLEGLALLKIGPKEIEKFKLIVVKIVHGQNVCT